MKNTLETFAQRESADWGSADLGYSLREEVEPTWKKSAMVAT